MEVKHREIREFLYKDEKDILRSIVRGLTQVRKHLVFSGFTLDTPDYEAGVANRTSFFAITESAWINEPVYPRLGGGNPFSYAYQQEGGIPAVGAYDDRQLINENATYYRTADGLSVVKACVRLVLWDK